MRITFMSSDVDALFCREDSIRSRRLWVSQFLALRCQLLLPLLGLDLPSMQHFRLWATRFVVSAPPLSKCWVHLHYAYFLRYCLTRIQGHIALCVWCCRPVLFPSWYSLSSYLPQHSLLIFLRLFLVLVRVHLVVSLLLQLILLKLVQNVCLLCQIFNVW